MTTINAFLKDVENYLRDERNAFADELRKDIAALRETAKQEERVITLLRKAVDLVLEDWPEDHPTVEGWLRDTRAVLASQLHVSDNSK